MYTLLSISAPQVDITSWLSSHIMELDPSFFEPASPTQVDGVTVVELDQSWQSSSRSPGTFLNVCKPFKDLRLRTTDWEDHRDKRLRIRIGCKLASYQSATVCMVILTAVRFLSSNTSTDPAWRRQKLSERYQIPDCFWSPTCLNLNGCFGCENLYDEKDELRGHSRYIWAALDWQWLYRRIHLECCLKGWPVRLVTWFRFFIKQLAGNSSYASDPKYMWHEMGFFTRWLHSGSGSVVCFNVPAPFQKSIIDALEFIPEDAIACDAYAFHTLIADEVVKLYDDSVWRIRNVIRKVEKSRYRLFFLPKLKWSHHKTGPSSRSRRRIIPCFMRRHGTVFTHPRPWKSQ